MENIWIVFGSTGEYSDRTEWMVDAWRSEDAAKARVTELEAMLLESGLQDADDRYCDEYEAAIDALRAKMGDPELSIYYTGTRYYFGQCQLHP